MGMSLARHPGVGDAGRSVAHGGSRPVLARMLEDAQLITMTTGLGQAAGAASAGAAAAGAAGGGAAAGAAGAGPDPGLLEFDLKGTRRRSPR